MLKDWKRINLENVGNIDLPPNMEIQGGNYKKMMEKGKTEYGISASKVIFQQKDLNNLNQNYIVSSLKKLKKTMEEDKSNRIEEEKSVFLPVPPVS